MKPASPADAGLQQEEPLAPAGRARRYECTRAVPETPSAPAARQSWGEIWRLDDDATAVASRLATLGAAGIGGFADSGRDDDGLWLWRAPREPTVAALMAEHKGAPMAWRTATELVLALAQALAACERESLFPGPLEPADITAADITDAGSLPLHVRAQPLIEALLGVADAGERAGHSHQSSLSRWLPPEQASGAAWDNAGNRYVVGLIWYRLLAGAHPFSGAGMRRALADRAQRGAPPLADELAKDLPPGLHSSLFWLLHVDPDKRPHSADDIVARLRGFLADGAGADSAAQRTNDDRRSASGHGSRVSDNLAAIDALRARRAHRDSSGARVSSRRPSQSVTDPSTRPTAGAAAAQPTGRSHLRWALPALVAALGLAALGLGRSSRSTDAVAPVRAAIDRPDSAAQACASCHPRQLSEWRRSVMAHAGKSPLFQSLEMLIQEQVGRSNSCPEGAGILRSADPATACRAPGGLPITGAGGPLWCVNCHTPGENLAAVMPPWDGISAVSASRAPVRDLLPDTAMEGISCAFCHQVRGPVQPGVAGYQGNPFWTSFVNGQRFTMRPEDGRGLFGIANSGYSLSPQEFLAPPAPARDPSSEPELVLGGAHRRPSEATRAYLRSSEFCGACHDVRLFGTDVIGARLGEHFKRLRNAYTEWTAWRDLRTRSGRPAASCQDCHMSDYPGVCVSGEVTAVAGRRSAADGACPPGTHFEARAAGSYPDNRVSAGSPRTAVTRHYFSGVDIPLAADFDPGQALIDDTSLDPGGLPLGGRQRRDLLLAGTFRFAVGDTRARGSTLEIPIDIENIGAGHRVPAGFSQEREIWVHLRVTDSAGAVLYEVGRVERGDRDLADKIFTRVNVDDSNLDRQGQPIGLFGADIIDGPDVPAWQPPPERGGTAFRGRGLINFQNGFLRCVRCIGVIDGEGRCQPGIGQGRTRADRFTDGIYDLDSGQCISNLDAEHSLFEVFFPVGALDASRGLLRGPDAIVDTRSIPPETPVRYTYELPGIGNRGGAITIEARLLFRAFPPFLIRAFADYEARQARLGRRPSGPLITHDALQRLEVVEIAAHTVIVTPAAPAAPATPATPGGAR